MDMEYREVAEEAGIHGWRRAPALNTDAEFVSDMAAAVLEALNAPAVSIAEACAANNVELVEKPLQQRSRGKSRRLNDDDDPSPPGFPDEKLYTQQTPWTNTGKNSKIDSGRLKNRRKCVDDRNNDEGPVFARIWKPEILYARLSEAGILGGILLEVLQSKGTMHCVFGL
uniref:Uncharacterized protein n=1 Tax=Pinguiococcus pyrenoidosus TaxID=172671 RepID=A0A7R9U2V9_9STRA|mmetsp:Transcript_12941/g.47959  ORF Transcript_12941/g.47959 Transcript_12941/m.47959 type:complete len:170 (+) Transcript_12941:2-511(+)